MLFNSPFIEKAAYVICNIDQQTILDLYERSLLRRHDISGHGNNDYVLYSFHQSIRSETEKLQDKTSLEEKFGKQFATFYRDLLGQTYDSLFTQDASLATERFNLIYEGDENDFDRSLNFCEKSEIPTIATFIGNIIFRFGHYSQSLEYYKKALEIDEQLNNRVSMATDYNNIGLAYDNKGEYDTALEYYKKALEILQSLDDQINIVILHVSMGHLYLDMKKFDESIKSFIQAENIVNAFEKQTGKQHPSHETVKNIMTKLREMANQSE